MTQAEMYAELCALTQRADRIDASYHAAFYLLSTDEELFRKARAHVTYDGVDFTSIKRACRGMEQQQREVLSIAHNLFSWRSPCQVTPHNLSRLSCPTLDHVCSAMYIANGSVAVQIHENESGAPELCLDDSEYKLIRRIYQQLSSHSLCADGFEENDMEIE